MEDPGVPIGLEEWLSPLNGTNLGKTHELQITPWSVMAWLEWMAKVQVTYQRADSACPPMLRHVSCGAV